VLAGLVSALAACGGGGGDERSVAGPGFTFSAPAGWDVETRGRSSSASPEEGATALVSVRVFRLARPYRPGLWETVEPELDRVAAELAEQLGGRIDSSATVVVDGRRAKRYDIRYERDGTEVVERTAFVLEGRREFQLVCRYEAADEDEGPRACAMLFSTLRLV
jgi:hypothetical protein